VNIKGLKKCCISSAMDGTDDDMLWNDRKGMLGVCEEDDSTYCEAGDSDSDW
jgi:hypothetical protein